MKIDRRDFIKYSVLGMSAAALLGPAQKGDPSRIFIWHNRTGGYETGQDGRIDTSRWNDEKFYSPYPKEKMVEAILKGKVTVNGKEVNTVEALMALGEPTLVIEPGRSLVGDSAVTLARVSQVRKIEGWHNLLTLEMNVTSFGTALVYMPVQRWEIINDYDRKAPEPFEAFVGGNLCFSGDMLAKYKISLQRSLSIGNLQLFGFKILVIDPMLAPVIWCQNANNKEGVTA